MVTKILSLFSVAVLANVSFAQVKSEEVVKANNAFGWKMYSELLKTHPKNENLLFSPLSASVALSLAESGAKGETFNEIGKALQQPKLEKKELNSAVKELVSSLLSDKDTAETIRIANAIWTNKENFEINAAFQKEANKFYNPDPEIESIVRNEPFSESATLENINGWVSKSTNEMIDSILDELQPDMVYVLLNALFFEGQWYKSFVELLTQEEDFAAANGDEAKVKMMHDTRKISYSEQNGYKLVSLGFRANKDKADPAPRAGRFIVDFVLPANNKKKITDVSGKDYEALLEKAAQQKVELALPKMKYSYKQKLNSALVSLGMKTPFSRSSADFTPMGKALDGGRIYISEVLQKTAVEMDENGFKAAAVTAVIGRSATSIGRPEDIKEFKADQPFYYALRDTKTGAVLFQGLVNDPSKE